MTDINPDTPDTPIVVPNSPVAVQTATATRDILVLVSAIPALIAVIGTRDTTKVVAYIGSVEFAPALGLIVGAAVLAWRQWQARRKVADLQVLEQHVGDSVAVRK